MRYRDQFASEPELHFLEADAFDEIRIVSKYGAIGPLVWSQPPEDAVATRRLLVYAETISDPDIVSRVQHALRWSRRLPSADAISPLTTTIDGMTAFRAE